MSRNITVNVTRSDDEAATIEVKLPNGKTLIATVDQHADNVEVGWYVNDFSRHLCTFEGKLVQIP